MGKEIKIECEFTEMVSISDLIPNELNTNKHPDDQIERLAELIEYYGVRHPIIVSKRSGKIAAGEGRFYAAKKLGMTQFPVDYQDFKDEQEEISFITADNAISSWSNLDFIKINQQLADFSPDFNLDMLGIKNFSIDGGDLKDITGATEYSINEFETFKHTCPRCGFEYDSSAKEKDDVESKAATFHSRNMSRLSPSGASPRTTRLSRPTWSQS